EILAEEYGRLGLSFQHDTPAFIVERQLDEARRADYLLCPSKHVVQSFTRYGIPEEKCRVIPYGANVDMFQPKQVKKDGFTILFVGTVGVRKGLVYLFKALEELQGKHEFRCTLIGGLEEPFRPIYQQYTHLFNHIPHVPHHELADYYSKASVFVFPSLDEGMALVQLEALACGLPVICTPNSGGDSVVEEGEEGFVVPIRDYQSIASKLKILISNPALVKSMSEKARIKATSFSWDVYGERLAAFLSTIRVKELAN
ncbi:MAG: glycosyltransferase family 1 protein, partial [Chitinophagaceae bacterium]